MLAGMMPFFHRFSKFLFYALKKMRLLLLPAVCPVCGIRVQAEKLAICGHCYAKLPFWHNAQQVPPPTLPKHVAGMTAPFLYQNDIRKLILLFKFKDRVELADILTHFLYLNWQNNPLAQVDVVLPVPLHPKRLRHRFFNQSAMLAVRLAPKLGVPYALLALRRVRHTPQQVGKTLVQRKKSMKGAFVCSSAAVQGKNVLLVDDVWTTGSTASACAKAILAAGANKVYVTTLAYVSPQRPEEEHPDFLSF